MIIERTESEAWLSNAYLVADREGGHGVLIDGNGVTAPLIEAAERLGVSVDAVLLTHHHGDHLAGIDEYRRRFGAPVLAHPATAAEVDAVDRTVDEGDVLEFGDLRIEVLHTPGHAGGHLALLVDGSDVFTA